MPTYAFTTTKRLTPGQKRKIVESVTAIHAAEAAAPRYFVQVVFYGVEEGAMFIGGEAAGDDHVWVNALIRAGRTREQKAAILTGIMRETSAILEISEQSVWVNAPTVGAGRVKVRRRPCWSLAGSRRGWRLAGGEGEVGGAGWRENPPGHRPICLDCYRYASLIRGAL